MLRKKYYLGHIKKLQEEITIAEQLGSFFVIPLKEILQSMELLFFTYKGNYPAISDVRELIEKKPSTITMKDLESTKSHLNRFERFIDEVLP